MDEIASWLWSLALRVAVLGWQETVTDGDAPDDLMESALAECGLIW